MPWTKSRLEEVAKSRLEGARLAVVANREPFIHVYDGDRVRCMKPASGLTTALDTVMRACGGVWVAHGSGEASRWRRVNRAEDVVIGGARLRLEWRG